jgi:hypothetical protein
LDALRNQPDFPPEWVDALSGDATAGQLYKLLIQAGDAAAATKALREAGIPGIKYLDGQSRAAGEGSRNYVLFDDSRIKIREINGKAVERAPDPPATLAEAETRVGKPQTNKQLAEDLGVPEPDKLATRLLQEDAAKAKALPNIELGGTGPLGEMIAQEHARARAHSDRLGLTADIERLAYEGYTAHQIGMMLSDRMAEVDMVTAANESDSQADLVRGRTQFARLVRNTLGIPSVDSHTEYAEWRSAYEARQRTKPVPQSKKPVEDIPEIEDVNALRRAGVLTDADERALVEADELVKRVDTYGDAYNILSSCVLNHGQ